MNNNEICDGAQIVKPFRNIITDKNEIFIFNWKDYLA